MVEAGGAEHAIDPADAKQQRAPRMMGRSVALARRFLAAPRDSFPEPDDAGRPS